MRMLEHHSQVKETIGIFYPNLDAEWQLILQSLHQNNQKIDFISDK